MSGRDLSAFNFRKICMKKTVIGSRARGPGSGYPSAIYAISSLLISALTGVHVLFQSPEQDESLEELEPTFVSLPDPSN
jgi:hypothetical protein